MMWFEDVQTGVKTDIGTYTFTAEKIIDFAQKYDPQSFHLSVEAGEASVFGALIASGWHTVSVWMKLMVASRQTGDDRPGDPPRSGASPGFEALRWVKPVRAGMTLRYSTQVLEKVDLKSRPHLGLVKSLNEARDEATGALMMSFIGKGFMPKRPKGE